MAVRNIVQTVQGQRTTDGAGVKLVRVLSDPNVEAFDPFLMLDAFDSRNPEDYTKGFPWHPHRGIETITYLIEGEIEHGDSLGNQGVIGAGGCQWMTAGGGILHQEMPQASERMLGVQLWLNLAARDKMTSPKYRDITASMVPQVKEPGVLIRVVSEQYQGTAGAMQSDYVPMTFLDVDMDLNAEFRLQTASDHTLFIYIVEGSGWFGPERTEVQSSKQALLFGPGEQFIAATGAEQLRFLLFSAPALKEPVAWGGPIVMNTEAELRQAYADLRDGSFVR